MLRRAELDDDDVALGAPRRRPRQPVPAAHTERVQREADLDD
jgi:hypothetical protein